MTHTRNSSVEEQQKINNFYIYFVKNVPTFWMSTRTEREKDAVNGAENKNGDGDGHGNRTAMAAGFHIVKL